jgi:hypothetical protein
MSDIVERLRLNGSPLCLDAASAIERLRAILADDDLYLENRRLAAAVPRLYRLFHRHRWVPIRSNLGGTEYRCWCGRLAESNWYGEFRKLPRDEAV